MRAGQVSNVDSRLARIVAALTLGHRVIVESSEPIDDLAQAVWCRLPRSVRCRTTVATWAFGNGNRFDLVALPKLAGVAVEATDLIVRLEEAPRC
jgi:hypothetical protein